MSGIDPAQFMTSCGSSVEVTRCRSVLEISCRGNANSALVDIVRAFDIGASPARGCVAGGNRQLAWMAPRRWWLICEKEKPPDASLAGIAVTEIGDALMRLTIRGASARDWLARYCPVDLRAKSFTSGRIAWTSFCESRVLLHCRDENVFDVYVDRSLSQYIVDTCSGDL